MAISFLHHSSFALHHNFVMQSLLDETVPKTGQVSCDALSVGRDLFDLPVMQTV